MNRTSIEDMLSALGEELVESGAAPTGLLVCGGASLIVNQWVTRTTQDVDVLTFFGAEDPEQEDLCRCDELPEYLTAAVSKVASGFGLSREWLNMGPSGLIQLGLPRNLLARSIRRDYGQKLRVFYLSRFDQIHFKLYAALGGDDRHFQDLVKLKPSEAEIRSAKTWVENILYDAILPSDMSSVMEGLGYGYLLE